MTSYFISDLHLSAERPELISAFEQFLFNTAANADALYILGDFFDAWIGDDDDSEVASKVKSMLSKYSASGTQCFFMRGNRDFLIGDVFAQETGFKILEEATVVDLYGQPTLLMHGDSLCTQDQAYMQFRAMVRSEQWQSQVLSLPLAQRRAMAAQLRDQSQSMSAMKAEDIMDVTQEEVIKIMEANNVKRLIHGHTHRPATHDLVLSQDHHAQRIVLGDWGSQGWAIKASQDEPLSLYSFDIKNSFDIKK